MTVTTKYYNVVDLPSKAYWDIDDVNLLLSHHADINIAMSPRNYGKSYAGRVKCHQFMDKGETVGWLRYNKLEMEKAINSWMEFDSNLELSRDKNGVKVLTDPFTGGRVVFSHWSTAHNNRDTDYPFKMLVYDEIVPPRYTKKTRLDTEFGDWYDTDTSLSRSYNPIKLLICNNIYWMNPFFVQWGIVPFGKGQIQKSTNRVTIEMETGPTTVENTIAVWNVAGTDAIIKRNIQQQALMFRTDAEMQSYYNNEMKQEYTTIAKCPEPKTQLENYQLMSEGYYMGCRYYDGMYYFCKVNWDKDKDTYVSEPAYVDIMKDHYRVNSVGKEFEDAFNAGVCAFDCAETLFSFFRWLRNMRMRV